MALRKWGGLRTWGDSTLIGNPVNKVYFGGLLSKDIKYYNGTVYLPVLLSVNGLVIWSE